MTHIDRPKWANLPNIRFSPNFPHQQKLVIQEKRSELLEYVHKQVEDFVNDTDLTANEGDDFPSWNYLSGEYYIGDENYRMNESTMGLNFHISIFVHCLEKPWKNRFGAEVENRDYLGLEIHLKWNSLSHTFDPLDVDSSAI